MPRVCRRNNDMAQPFFCFWFRFQISGPHSIPLPRLAPATRRPHPWPIASYQEEERAGDRTEPSAAKLSLSNNSSTAVAHGTVVTGPSRLSQKVCPRGGLLSTCWSTSRRGPGWGIESQDVAIQTHERPAAVARVNVSARLLSTPTCVSCRNTSPCPFFIGTAQTAGNT